MGRRCFLVAMLIVFCGHSVFARNCANILDQVDTNDCGECIRCGGYWCNDPNELKRCVSSKADSWCSETPESFDTFQEIQSPGNRSDPFDYRFVEKRASVSKSSVAVFQIMSSGVKGGNRARPVATMLNSTQSSDVQTEVNWLNGNQFEVGTTVGQEFCLENATKTEYVYVNVTLPGSAGGAIVKYHVPCACRCEEFIETKSPSCSGHGNLTCGVCQCENGRSGRTCNEEGDGRGDLNESCINPATNITCSGNGICRDNTCECFEDSGIDGLHYFDKHSFCEDICTTTSNYTNCLQNPTSGVCPITKVSYVTIENENEISLNETDDEERRVWARCNVTLEGCGRVEYAARRKDGEEYLVVLKHCDAVSGLIVTGRPVTVPVVFTVLALVVAAAAAAGYVFWKARGPPSPPLNESGYTNVDAEECVGENPLYKPPTSSFKNPMYGKC